MILDVPEELEESGENGLKTVFRFITGFGQRYSRHNIPMSNYSSNIPQFALEIGPNALAHTHTHILCAFWCWRIPTGPKQMLRSGSAINSVVWTWRSWRRKQTKRSGEWKSVMNGVRSECRSHKNRRWKRGAIPQCLLQCVESSHNVFSVPIPLWGTQTWTFYLIESVSRWWRWWWCDRYAEGDYDDGDASVRWWRW